MNTRIAKTGVVLLALFAGIFLAYCNQGENANQGASGAADNHMAGLDSAGMVERGKYLVTVGGCNDCHTPKIWSEHGPELDTSRYLAGHYGGDTTLAPVGPGCLTQQGWVGATNADFTAWVGPWGISYSANITPDQTFGIGSWTSEAFVKTMRTGLHLGAGRPILPPMPWQNLALATDEDLSSIFSYLMTIKPVANEVPQPTPPTGAPQGGGSSAQ